MYFLSAAKKLKITEHNLRLPSIFYNSSRDLKSARIQETGLKYVENKNEKGEVEITELPEKCTGFVINDKPDIQIGQILPYLYLSSQDVAQDNELLNANSITHVLSIGVDLPNTNLKNIKFKKLDLLDEPNSDITETLALSFQFIETAKTENENNRILVHCNAGYSRAPTIIIGYLMKKFGFTLNESYKIVNEKRNVKPNEGFLKQLRKLEQSKADL